MELKTKVTADEGKQELFITRDFELPVELLFRAYTDPEIVGQWMGTTVLRLDGDKNGSYRFQTTEPNGTKHGFSGVIHELIPNEKITRTFEMETTPFEPWLEFLEFDNVSADSSRVRMHVIYKSVPQRDQLLKMPFAQGINWAHNRIEEVMRERK